MKYAKCGKHQRKTRDARARAPLKTLRKHANGRVTIPNEARTMQDITNNIEIQ
jgi:hypothetical protein